jgi:outer membrane immunogenic protein
MRKMILAVSALAISTMSAYAADLPAKARPYPPPPLPVWSWTGFYIGGHLGAGWSRNEFSEGRDGHFDPGTDLGSHNGLGPLGGFQVGYNWQVPNGPLLIGVEGDFSFADLKGDHQNTSSAALAATFGCFDDRFACSAFALLNAQERFSTKVKDTATITARIGITSGPQDRTLWYVKGGAAWAKTDYADSATFSEVACVNFVLNSACAAANGSLFSSGSSSRWGWTVGTGVEWALWDNWSTKIEYNFLQFDSHDVTLQGRFDNGDIFRRTVSVDQQIHQIKFGLNYRFNWGKYPVGKSPVVASY